MYRIVVTYPEFCNMIVVPLTSIEVYHVVGDFIPELVKSEAHECIMINLN